MKIDETKPIAPVRKVLCSSSRQPSSNRPEHPAREVGDIETTLSGELDEIDISAFRGLSPDDLTENARDAMLELIQEIGQLRQELSRGRKRIAYLSNLADTTI